MSIARLRERVPSAEPLGCRALKQHTLRFHKAGQDGSGKCDAFYTGDDEHILFGALFELDPFEKHFLDKVEGLGYGYDEKSVVVHAEDGSSLAATTYFATAIEEALKPYTWYVNHVLVGAGEMSLPAEYIQSRLRGIESTQDPDQSREASERAIYETQRLPAEQ
jgi:hypothetical protein